MPRILGFGYDLPSRRVDNAELAQKVGSTASAIESDTGISERRYAAAGDGPSDLAKRAADRALAMAGLGPTDAELLVFATLRPDVTFPGSGCYLQEKLGCGTIGSLDVRGQCTGFLVALDVARQFVDAGTYDRVLVAGADVHSTALDFSPRGAPVTPLFGDGAAVFVLGAGDGDVIDCVIHADGRDLERFWCEFPSSRNRPVRMTAEAAREGRHHPRLDRAWLRETGPTRIAEAVDEVLTRAGLPRSEVKRFLFRTVLPDVSLEAARRLGIEERALSDGRDEGFVASAALPISYCRSIENGTIGPGDLVCLATVGAGATWGAALLRVPQ